MEKQVNVELNIFLKEFWQKFQEFENANQYKKLNANLPNLLKKSKDFYDFIRLATDTQKLAIIEALRQKLKQDKDFCDLDDKESRGVEGFDDFINNISNNIFFFLLPFRFYTTDPLFITAANFKQIGVFKTCLDLVNSFPVSDRDRAFANLGFAVFLECITTTCTVGMVEGFIDELTPEQKRLFAAVRVPLDEDDERGRGRFATVFQVLTLDFKKINKVDKIFREQYKSCAAKLDEAMLEEDLEEEELSGKEPASDSEDDIDEIDVTEIFWEILNRKTRKPLLRLELKRAVKCIIAGADLKSKNAVGLSPLHFIFRYPIAFHRDLLFAMLGQGADLLELDPDKRRAVDVALNLNNEAIFAALLDFFMHNQVGEIPIRNQNKRVCIPDLIYQAILKHGQVSTKIEIHKVIIERAKFSLLLTAVRGNNTQQIKKLLAEGTDINCGSHKCLALIEAVTHNKPEAVELLLDVKADVEKAVISDAHPLYLQEDSRLDFTFVKEGPGSKNGISAVQYAINLKYTDVVKMMLKYGLSPTADDLHVAITKKDIETAKLLVEAGAPIDTTKDKKYGLIHDAMLNIPDIVPMLLEYGANIDGSSIGKGRAVNYFESRAGYLENGRSRLNCLLTQFLIIQGAYPDLREGLFFPECNRYITQRVSKRFSNINFDQVSAQSAKIIWENRSLLPREETIDLFELFSYRLVLAQSLDPKNVTLLIRYAELDYCNLWKDYTLQNRAMCYLMFKVLAREAAETLCQAQSKEISVSLQKLGIPNNSVTDKTLKEKLQEILENLLRANLSPVRTFAPIIQYEKSLRLYHVYQALPKVLADMVKAYLGPEVAEYSCFKHKKAAEDCGDSENDSETETVIKIVTKPVYRSLEVPLISFGRFNGAAIVEDIRKLEKVRLEAVERLFGASLERTVTVDARVDHAARQDKDLSGDLGASRNAAYHEGNEDREQLIEKLMVEDSKLLKLQVLALPTLIAVLDVLHNQLTSKIEKLTEISQQLEELEGLTGNSTSRALERLSKAVELSEKLGEELDMARKFETQSKQINPEKPEVLRTQLQSMAALKKNTQTAIESHSKYIKDIEGYIKKEIELKALLSQSVESVAKPSSKVVKKKFS